MAKFPRNEPTIVTLAQEMVAGLMANAATFPDLPVPPAGPPGSPNLTELTASYTAARDEAIAARAAAERATTAKNAHLDVLVGALKRDLRHAETIADFDDDLLKRIGWSGRKAKTRLLPPGQCQTLAAPRQGEGWVFLDWWEPIDGGKPAAYKIQRRQQPADAWGRTWPSRWTRKPRWQINHAARTSNTACWRSTRRAKAKRRIRCSWCYRRNRESTRMKKNK